MGFRRLAEAVCVPMAAACLGCTGTVADDKPEVKDTFDGGSPSAHVALTGCPQAGYAGTFTVGGAPFSMLIDTGSADIGVAATGCSTCDGVSPLYTPGAGATDDGVQVSVTYVGGQSWTGEAFTDSFGAGAATASTRLVAIASQSGDFFSNAGCGFGAVPVTYQGITGFGPAILSDVNTDDPMTALAATGVPNLFAFTLCDASGDLWLGGYGAESPPKTTPLLSALYYEIGVADLGVGGNMLGLTRTAIGNVIIDTGNTEFAVPTPVYDALTAAIGQSASFQAHFGDSTWFDAHQCTTTKDGALSPTDLDSVLPMLTLRLDDGAGGTIDVDLKATQSYLDPVRSGSALYFCPEIEPESGGSTFLGAGAIRRELVVIDRAAGKLGLAPYSRCPGD